MSSRGNGHRGSDARARLRDTDPVTERDPETQDSEIAAFRSAALAKWQSLMA